MTFNDLPENWRRRSLTDPVLAADVVDLYCTAGDRRRGALTLFVCDEHDHFRGAIVIDLADLTDHRHPTGRAAALRPVIRPLQVYPGGALLLALSRPGPPVTTPVDRAWGEAAVRVCRGLGVRLLGLYLASRDRVVPADLTPPVVLTGLSRPTGPSRLTGPDMPTGPGRLTGPGTPTGSGRPTGPGELLGPGELDGAGGPAGPGELCRPGRASLAHPSSVPVLSALPAGGTGC